MRRRDFIGSLSLLGAAFGLPWTATQARENSRLPTPRKVLLQSSPLAGFQYHDGEVCWPELRLGDVLTLVRESRNIHDPRAVAIEWEGRRLGYIPRVENTALSTLLDSDETLTANISALTMSRNPWERVRMEVWLWV